jgi:hypothetical protein
MTPRKLPARFGRVEARESCVDRSRPLRATIVLTVVSFFANGCGGGSNPTPAMNPTPSISWVSPASAAAGAAAFTLIVAGNDFSSSSLVQWNGSARPTAYVRPTQLTASITDSDVATAGTASVAEFLPGDLRRIRHLGRNLRGILVALRRCRALIRPLAS